MRKFQELGLVVLALAAMDALVGCRLRRRSARASSVPLCVTSTMADPSQANWSDGRKNQACLAVFIVWSGAAPSNYTFALLEDGRGNRRPGDIVDLGMLSSSIPAMAAMSNRTWHFEQPAPFTYPIYQPTVGDAGAGLNRIDPFITSAAEERALFQNADAARAWRRQLAEKGAFFCSAKLCCKRHRYFPVCATSAPKPIPIANSDHHVQCAAQGDASYAEVLKRMTLAFAETSKAEGQTPIIILIQSRWKADANLVAILTSTLDEQNIRYFDMEEHYDPSDPSGFAPDGHYKPLVDQMFAQELCKAGPYLYSPCHIQET